MAAVTGPRALAVLRCGDSPEPVPFLESPNSLNVLFSYTNVPKWIRSMLILTERVCFLSTLVRFTVERAHFLGTFVFPIFP